jgi:uncharacterized membrane protein YhaH (DUF805 family)
MNISAAVSSCFRNYVNFSGRAVRSEYWYWALCSTLVSFVFGVVDETLNPGTQLGVFSMINMAVVLGLFLPGLAVSVRRLHDVDRTGWWLLLGFTGVGIIPLIYWACQRGTPGQNRFGSDQMPSVGVLKGEWFETAREHRADGSGVWARF